MINIIITIIHIAYCLLSIYVPLFYDSVVPPGVCDTWHRAVHLARRPGVQRQLRVTTVNRNSKSNTNDNIHMFFIYICIYMYIYISEFRG